MMTVKLKAKPKLQTLERAFNRDAAWLEWLLRRTAITMSPHEALIPVAAGTPILSPDSRVLAYPALRLRAEQITQKAQTQRLPVFPVAIAPLFAGWRLHTQSPNYDYVFCNLAEDPLFADPDGFPIPQRVLTHLKRLQQLGLGQELDLLYVVHEVEKGAVREGEALDADKLVPPSLRVQRASRRLGQIGTALWLGATLPGLIGGAAVRLTAAGALPLALVLDPLLLGAAVAPGRPVRAGEEAVWFYLAQWSYNEEEAP